jgi:DNA-binding response OmpR family regulator
VALSKVLVVDDAEAVTLAVKDILEAQGYLVDTALEPDMALTMLKVSSYDLIILDWHMPQISGIEFLSRLRLAGDEVAVLMLTSADTSEEKVIGLETGADDYLTKPFNHRELVARVRALLRRPKELKFDELKASGICINTKSRKVMFRDLELALTKQEYLLLEYLMRNLDTPFSSEALVKTAWSALSDTAPDAVRVHMHRLRKKLELLGGECPIQTVKGKGYFISADS